MNYLSQILSYLTFNDIFRNIANLADNLLSSLQGITLALGAAAVALSGLMFFGGETTSRIAKKWLISVIIGILLVFGATMFVQTVRTTGGF